MFVYSKHDSSLIFNMLYVRQRFYVLSKKTKREGEENRTMPVSLGDLRRALLLSERAPVASNWYITASHEQMATTASSLVPTIHPGVWRIVSFWLSSDHEYSSAVGAFTMRKVEDVVLLNICGWTCVRSSIYPSFITDYFQYCSETQLVLPRISEAFRCLHRRHRNT